ncbi:tRNA glutamyl-Q(34) synthetase GluQRS [Xanthobacter sp. TB0139]|uniref:tRNA glutamyl-Q(34) synthetase GluQRS n=1 Tax=Xanthobacter sp. TB0139 TaxID=3459178 RepID=UPI004039740A
MSTLVCRFAPSPNGYLHLGHAFSAILNARTAERAGGRFLLRLEDIDSARCRPEYERAILEDMAWLGLQAAEPPRRQSAHFADYAAVLDRLEAMGLIYPTFESRGEIARAVVAQEEARGVPARRDPDGAPLYPFSRTSLSDVARAQRRAAGEAFVLRLDMAAALEVVGAAPVWQETQGDDPLGSPAAVQHMDAHAWGDVVLARRDTPTSYHLSVVVDDALQGVTHVIRGADLKAASVVHVLLQRLLGLPSPVYHHHRLILDEAGHKLSKSHGATSLRALRAAGVSAQEIYERLGLAVPSCLKGSQAQHI